MTQTRPRQTSNCGPTSQLIGIDPALVLHGGNTSVLALQIKTFLDEGGFDDCDGLVLENHGLFTFSEDAHKAYTRHIELVGIAESYLSPPNFRHVQPGPPALSYRRTSGRPFQVAAVPATQRFH